MGLSVPCRYDKSGQAGRAGTHARGGLIASNIEDTLTSVSVGPVAGKKDIVTKRASTRALTLSILAAKFEPVFRCKKRLVSHYNCGTPTFRFWEKHKMRRLYGASIRSPVKEEHELDSSSIKGSDMAWTGRTV